MFELWMTVFSCLVLHLRLNIVLWFYALLSNRRWNSLWKAFWPKYSMPYPGHGHPLNWTNQNPIKSAIYILTVDERHFDEPLPQQNLPCTEDVSEVIFGGVAMETEKVMESTEVTDSTASFRTLEINSDEPIVKETFEKLQYVTFTSLCSQNLQFCNFKNHENAMVW